MEKNEFARCRLRQNLRGLDRLYKVYRRPKDKYGEPQGDPVEVGTVCGYFYSKANGISVTINLPGNLTSRRKKYLLEIVSGDMLTVEKGDTIEAEGENLTVLCADEVAEIYRVIYFED